MANTLDVLPIGCSTAAFIEDGVGKPWPDARAVEQWFSDRMSGVVFR